MACHCGKKLDVATSKEGYLLLGSERCQTSKGHLQAGRSTRLHRGMCKHSSAWPHTHGCLNTPKRGIRQPCIYPNLSTRVSHRARNEPNRSPHRAHSEPTSSPLRTHSEPTTSPHNEPTTSQHRVHNEPTASPQQTHNEPTTSPERNFSLGTG